jgi:hypothetical protein
MLLKIATMDTGVAEENGWSVAIRPDILFFLLQ